MTTSELFKAIKTFVADPSSGPLLNTITGGFHLVQASVGAAFPYCVVTPIGGARTNTYAGGGFGEPQFQFTVRHSTPSDALVALNAVMTQFDNKILTLASGQHFDTERTSEPIVEPDDPQPDEQGRDSEGWLVMYRFAAT